MSEIKEEFLKLISTIKKAMSVLKVGHHQKSAIIKYNTEIRRQSNA
jgi:hypothetical protein